MEWLRWYHGCVTDPKFRLIARRSGQNVASVIALWAALLERASEAEERGDISGVDCESLDALFGLDDGACQDIVDALRGKGMIVDDRIAKWEERQPVKEDPTAAERKRKQRERDREKKGDASHDVTPCHDASHDVTPRLEKRREEKSKSLNTTPSGNTSRAGARDEVPGDGVCEEEPGIEFSELRETYDRLAKPEAPLDGFVEFKTAKKARSWPGITRVMQGIAELSQHDDAWKRGYAPGLAKFIRTRGWEKPPQAAQARAAPMPSTYNQAQDLERRTTAAKVLRRMEEEKNGVLPAHTGGTGQALRALPEGDTRA